MPIIYHIGERVSIHHGTLAFNIDLNLMKELLNVSANKLKKHGIESVRSRVKNIKQLYPEIQLEDIVCSVKQKFADSFCEHIIEDIIIDEDSVDRLALKYRSDQWIFCQHNDYIVKKTENFEWGEISVLFEYEGNTAKKIQLVTDSLEADLIVALMQELNKENELTVLSCQNAIEKIKEKYADSNTNIDDIEKLLTKAFEV